MNNQACKLTAIQIISSDSVDDNFQQVKSQLMQLPVIGDDCHHLVLLPENVLFFC